MDQQTTEAFTDVARSVQSAWSAAFARSDWPALAALYTTDAALYGSTATLHTGRAGVLSYFEGLPPGYVAAEFAPPHILPLGPDLFSALGAVVFAVRFYGRQREYPYRMSQVFRRTPEGWRIALHHASPTPV